MTNEEKVVLPNAFIIPRLLAPILVALILSGFVSCGGGGGSTSSPGPSPNPVPSIASLSPSSVTAGAASQTLTINGTNFLSSSTVTYNSIAHTPTFVSSTQLTIPLSTSDQAMGGDFAVVVTNPSPGGGPSNSMNFTVKPPTISSVSVVCSPTQILLSQTSSCTATVQGTGNFSSTVIWTATEGTIDSSGVFAPTSSGPAKITATSSEDSTKSSTVQITVATPTALVITITDLPAATAAKVSVTDPDGNQTALTSSGIINAIPGTYTITAGSVVVENSTYSATEPTQTVTVTSGNSTSAIVDYRDVTPSTTKVLDSTALASLSVSSDGLTLTMSASSPVAASLAPGDVVIVPPTAAGGVAPKGMLRQVASVSTSDSQVVAATQTGTLAEAFERVSLQVQNQLTTSTVQAVHPAPGVTFRPGATLQRVAEGMKLQSTSTSLADPCGGFSLGVFDVNQPIQVTAVPGLTLSGSVEICSGLNFSADLIGSGFLDLVPKLNSLTATASMGAYSDLTLQGDILTGSFSQQITLATLDFPPIEVPGLPVWVTPEVSVFVGANGSLSSGITTEVSASGSFTGGVTYASGTWSPVPLTPSLQFAYQPPTLDASLSAKAFAGIEFDLYIYDIVGPSFKPDGYLDLEANISQNPWWTLTGGLEGPMSLDVTFLGENLASYDLGTMFDYSKVIASASGAFAGNPVPTITQLSPASLPAATAPQTLTINGTGFLSSSTVTLNGIAHSPAFVSASQLTISLTASDLATAGSFPVIVTNPAPGGGPSNSVSFVVTAQTVSVTVSPLTAQVTVNGSQQFAATVANTSNTAVTWSVNNVIGGNSTVGAINENGLYTAPAAIPDPATVTVTATSQAVTTVSGSAQITVIPAVTLTVLHSFTGTDGAVPWASLIQTSDGTFYGTTVSGGDLSCYGYFGQGCGTAFKMDAEGNLSVLHSFTGLEGEIPSAPLILGSDSNFYGTTEFGGGSSNCLISGQSTPAGCGTAFKMDSLGNISTLYAFSSFSNPEGVAPTAPLLQAIDSNFYGTTLEGGDTSCSGSYGPSPTTGCGSIFMLDSSGSLTVLHEFTGTEGAYLSAPLIQVTGGNFYGLTLAGGNLSCSSYAAPGCGTIFTMTTSGSVTALHSFSGSDGAFPTGALILANDGNFYGATVFGGDLSCAGGAQWQGCGVVFNIDATGTFNVLHAFSVSDGAYPGSSLLQASDGYFYGTTQGGGDLTCTGRYGPGCGTVFRMDSEGNVVVLYSFTGGTDGSWPESNLIQGLDGNLYGTTAYGGTADLGLVFQVSNFDPSSAATAAIKFVKPEAINQITEPRKGPHLGLPTPSPVPHR